MSGLFVSETDCLRESGNEASILPWGLTNFLKYQEHFLDCVGPRKVVKGEKLISVKGDTERRKRNSFGLT